MLARWALQVVRDGRAPFAPEMPPGVETPPPIAWHTAHRQSVAVRELGLHVVPIWALGAPFASLPAPPLLLFVRGNPALLQRRGALALVGARRASAGPLAWAHALASRWARAGALVVSGGALGIDAAAHAGALDGGGATLAYIGTPVDRIYPALNAPLFRRMLAAGGAIVSEHAPGAASYKAHHAARNRFIAGHAAVLVVAEARLRSGTLGAAGHAERCGTPVRWAPPEVGGAREGLRALAAQGRGAVYGQGDEAPLAALVRADRAGAAHDRGERGRPPDAH